MSYIIQSSAAHFVLESADSIREWFYKLHALSHPLAQYFEGEFKSVENEFDDPNVVFIGKDWVRLFALELAQTGKQFFIQHLPPAYSTSVGDAWLYEPLLNFLQSASAKKNAVLIFWS